MYCQMQQDLLKDRAGGVANLAMFGNANVKLVVHQFVGFDLTVKHECEGEAVRDSIL